MKNQDEKYMHISIIDSFLHTISAGMICDYALYIFMRF